MKKETKAPKQWWILGLFGTALVLSQPIFTNLHYTWNLAAGAYPPHADSIAIPIYQEFVAWMILAPIALAALWWAVWKSQGVHPLWGWNRERVIWSIFWTTIFGLLIFGFLTELPHATKWKNVPTIVNVALWTILFLRLRSLVVFKRSIMT